MRFLLLLLLFSTSCVTVNRTATRGTPQSTTCVTLRQEVNNWLGVRYQYGGQTRDGVDCSSFVQQVYRNVFDIAIPRTTTEQYAGGGRVRLAWLQCGDLVFFKNIRGRGIDHVGIYIGDNLFAHASSSAGVTYSSLQESYYRDHYSGARRYSR